MYNLAQGSSYCVHLLRDCTNNHCRDPRHTHHPPFFPSYAKHYGIGKLWKAQHYGRFHLSRGACVLVSRHSPPNSHAFADGTAEPIKASLFYIILTALQLNLPQLNYYNYICLSVQCAAFYM